MVFACTGGESAVATAITKVDKVTMLYGMGAVVLAIEIDRILKVADFIDQLFLLRVSAGKNAAIRQGTDCRNIHIPA